MIKIHFILFLIILISLNSCNLFSEKEYLYNGKDINSKDTFLIVQSYNSENFKIFTDSKIIYENINDFYVKSSDECHGTTPDGAIELYKNGKRISIISYCKFLMESPVLVGIQNRLKSCKLKKSISKDYDEYLKKNDSLKKIKDIYLLKNEFSSLNKYPIKIELTIEIPNEKQDVFNYELNIEKELKQIFKNGEYVVDVKWYMSSPKTKNKESVLGYHVYIDCNNKFLQEFKLINLDNSKIFENILFKKIENKTFEINYFQS
jgi:hypothetical protein